MTKLHVRVLEAEDIAKMDANATDAYCILTCGSAKEKTRVIKNNMHPTWNEDFHFDLAGPTSGSLNIFMRDKDIVKDDDMATLDIQVSSLHMGQVLNQWYNMTPCKKVKKGGKIRLLLHLSGASDTPFVSKAPQQGYGAPQPGYGAPPPGYGAPPPGYGAPH